MNMQELNLGCLMAQNPERRLAFTSRTESDIYGVAYL